MEVEPTPATGASINSAPEGEGGGGNAPATKPRIGGGRAWGALRAAARANAIPGLDTSNRARAQKLNFAEIVWKAKWQEEQQARNALRARPAACEAAPCLPFRGAELTGICVFWVTLSRGARSPPPSGAANRASWHANTVRACDLARCGDD